jgi:hypothetical protein
LFCFGLVWFGLVWFVLVCFVLFCCSFFSTSSSSQIRSFSVHYWLRRQNHLRMLPWFTVTQLALFPSLLLRSPFNFLQ